MTRVAEVSCAETEEHGNGAAEATLKCHMLLLMLGAALFRKLDEEKRRMDTLE